MKLIKTEDAVGHVLCHDITQIIKGVTKDAVFRKGHVVTEEDIPVLLSVGKEHLYVWEKDDTKWHENEAAEILYDICAGTNMHPSGIKRGKNRTDRGYRRPIKNPQRCVGGSKQPWREMMIGIPSWRFPR